MILNKNKTETWITNNVLKAIFRVNIKISIITDPTIPKTISIAKELGCKRFELDSGFQREGAHKFYESIGFEKRAYLFSKIL
jgi:hypothetical protein